MTPEEAQKRIALILTQLRSACGEHGFNYLAFTSVEYAMIATDLSECFNVIREHHRSLGFE